MAQRSFVITVENFTGLVWRRTDLGHSHGHWANNDEMVPPEQIPKLTLDAHGNAIPGEVQFGGESDGFATGTEGFVDYRSDAGNMRIGWDNPFIGSNGFGVDVPDGYNEQHSDIGGNNANVRVIIRKA
jgi:hypothetical protein